MKTKKPKRIRAVKCDMTIDGMVYLGHDKSCTYTEPCYLLRQSDIRALAEQLLRDMDDGYDRQLPPRCKSVAVLYALKSAGMTPGKAGAK